MATRLLSNHPVQETRANQRNWRTALGWWVVAGALGVLIRYQLVYPVAGLTYPFLLHAHSHVVLLGWTFNALFLALAATFGSGLRLSAYRKVWVGFQVAVLGMLLFFPTQGYATGSIVASTLHVFVSYYMVWCLWQDLRSDNSLSARLVRWGLFFFVLSTLGPYSVGILKARHLQETIWYPLSIYFYLHFLYNGWFIFGCLALLFRWLENWELVPTKQVGNRFIRAMALSAMGTLALSALWTNPPGWLWLIGGGAALLQAGSGVWLLGWLWQKRSALCQQLEPQAFALARLAFLSLGLKLMLQLLSALPWATQLAYAQRNLVIAYLHLVFIGVITFFLLAWAFQQGYIRRSGLAIGLISLFFMLTESVLVTESLCQQGSSYVPHLGEWLLALSVGLWIGVLLLWVRQLPVHVYRSFSLFRR
ncbi:hypothetical protein GO730_38065 [Spirosoma sp. HMF3257]|uniref:NnrS family protein n=1 Tax=Spirosoma telluris TaxID=2183553 RepID=A0A327NG99_9BACT|nr:hypothetical protein [Spirosoma telluris]MVM42128.1 hypothetical protein [Spirosoma telluris]RAI73044.1 hypothetical protein HMF3257_37195 [Spirosoma telluris]RAI73174.1 hypothetical protein HMF3257_37965 [Spirosoma telluris]